MGGGTGASCLRQPWFMRTMGRLVTRLLVFGGGGGLDGARRRASTCIKRNTARAEWFGAHWDSVQLVDFLHEYCEVQCVQRLPWQTTSAIASTPQLGERHCTVGHCTSYLLLNKLHIRIPLLLRFRTTGIRFRTIGSAVYTFAFGCPSIRQRRAMTNPKKSWPYK